MRVDRKIPRVLSLCAAIFLCLIGIGAKALEMPAFFANGMVLQRETKVFIWGKSNNGQVTLTTSWDNRTYQSAVDSEGKWKIEVSTGQAGGPFTIRVSDASKTIDINNVLLGDVWFASGQSNMEMSFKGFTNQPVNNAQATVQNSANDGIRFFRVVNKTWGAKLNDVSGEWLSASPSTTEDFSAAAYYFAKELNRELSVPVAIIQSDWGATPIQAWMSKESLQSFSSRVTVKEVGDNAYDDRDEPTGLYNAMIHPFLNYVLKGIIWYQGEANRIEPTLYQSLFPAMVADWRNSWAQTDVPFYYAQIAPYSDLDPQNITARTQRIEDYTPYLRDAQRVAENIIPNSGMAVLMDVGSESTIHPPDKETVGKRLSALVLNKTYGKQEIACYGPIYKSKSIVNNTIVLSFDHAEGLYIVDNQYKNFEIAGSDKIFYPAEAVVNGNEIIVTSSVVPNPTEVRYAFKAWTMGTLFNKDHLPASSFRTDNYTASEVGKPLNDTQGNLSAQIFSQNFSSGTSLTEYRSASPVQPNKFTHFTSSTGETVTTNIISAGGNSFLRFIKSGTTGIHVVRNEAIVTPTPTFMKLQFRIRLVAPTTYNDYNGDDITFYLGNDVGAYVWPNNTSATAPPDAAVHTKFAIKLHMVEATGTAEFSIDNPTTKFSEWKTITVFSNSSGVAKNYYGPDGAFRTIANNAFDVWVEGNNVINDAAAITSGVPLNRFKLLYPPNAPNATIQVDDFMVYNATVLPVTFTSFAAKQENTAVRLNWSTASETNNSHFEILRAGDQTDFYVIATVKGKGSSEQQSNYIFTDQFPLNGNNYYKLRQVDFDGKTAEHPNTLQVNVGMNKQLFYVSTDQTKSQLNIHLQSTKQYRDQLQIIDMNGRILLTKEVQVNTGQNLFQLADMLTNGLYIVRFKEAGHRIKFIK